MDTTIKAAPLAETAGRHTILVIDDEAMLRQVLGEILEGAGYPVITAASGPEGLQAFREHQQSIGLIILDMVMPQMGGLEVYRELRHIDSQCPVLVFTGFCNVADLEQLRREGIAGVLQKPMDLKNIQSTVAGILKPPASKCQAC